MRLYAVRDSVLDRVAPPFAAPNDAAAVRMYKSLNFPKGSSMDDYSLVYVGEYDEDKRDFEVVYSGPLKVVKDE